MEQQPGKRRRTVSPEQRNPQSGGRLFLNAGEDPAREGRGGADLREWQDCGAVPAGAGSWGSALTCGSRGGRGAAEPAWRRREQYWSVAFTASTSPSAQQRIWPMVSAASIRSRYRSPTICRSSSFLCSISARTWRSNPRISSAPCVSKSAAGSRRSRRFSAGEAAADAMMDPSAAQQATSARRAAPAAILVGGGSSSAPQRARLVPGGPWAVWFLRGFLKKGIPRG